MTDAVELSEDVRRMVTALEMTGNFRVLQRFRPKTAFTPYESDEARSNSKLAMVVDTETTGLDPVSDKMIELGYVMVRFNPVSGVVYEVESTYSGTEDPGFPLSAATIELTGLTDDVLKGTRLDEDRVRSDVERAVVVIAHNAGFDRRFLERRVASFSGRWFACSQREVPWKEAGSNSQKLEFLAFAVARVFYAGHRALVDAQVVVELLSRCGPDGVSLLKRLLDECRKPSWRVWAPGSAYETKDVLKANGYRWNDGKGPACPVDCWSKVTDSLDEQVEFLRAHVFPRGATLPVEKITGRERYSDRCGEMSTVSFDGLPAACEAVTHPAPADLLQDTRVAHSDSVAPVRPRRREFGPAELPI